MLRGQTSLASDAAADGAREPATASAGGAVVLTGPEGRVTFWNPAAERLYGEPGAGLSGRQARQIVSTEPDPPAGKTNPQALGAGSKFSELFDEQAWEAVSVASVLVKAGETVEPLVTLGLRHNGSTIDLELHPSPMRDGSGTISGVCWMIVDITAQSRDRSTRERSQQLRSRFEQGPTAEAILDLDGRLVCVNNALCELIGRDRDELEGTPAAALIDPSDGGATSRLDAMLISGPETDTWEPLVLHGGGQPLPTQIRAALLREPDGSLVGLAFSLHGRPASSRTEDVEALSRRAVELTLHMDPSARMRYVSPSAATVFAYDAAALIGRCLWDFVHPDDVDLAREALGQALATPGSAASATFRFVDSTTDWRWLEAAFVNHLDDPDIAAVVCTGRDVTQRATVERALLASETRRRAIADTAQEGIWAIEVSGRTLYANDKLATVLGMDLATVYQRNADEILSPDDGFIADQLRHRAERGPEVYEIRYQHPDGASRQLRLSVSPLQDEGPTGSLVMITDVTDAHDAATKLRARALHDELTGLANRSLLADRLEHAMARRQRLGGGPVAVIFADLDGFKLVNDSWGHAAGDALLVKVAERLSASARIDDTVARFGGDEFVIVCEDTDETQARRIADDLLAALSAPFQVDGRRVYVSASIGMAITPPESAQELLRFADAAMHDAKARGRGRIEVFDVALANEAADRLQMGNDLREALQRKQLTLDYQPVIDLPTGRIMAVEALARWTHPRYGAVPPARFVDVAETTGLAAMLGQWALERALQELGQVRRTIGAHVRVAVNISARHLADPDFEATVLAAMTAHDVPRGALLLEITESAVMSEPEQVQQVLERLRTRGVASAIDDFGTGYSSLGHLNTLPVDILKIDRAFIERMTQDSDSLAIVTSIVDLARIMNLATVAEGVETREQLTILRQLGCSLGQGFLWSKALPLAQLRTLVGTLPGSRFDVTIPGSGASHRPSPPEDQVTVAHGLQHIMRMHKTGASLTTIAAALNADGFRTPRGLRWHHASVGRVINDCAYPHLWSPDHD
jgi:diguanylate cyclase (GGDEF)-like protein/PAS domain S-box-containing protein